MRRFPPPGICITSGLLLACACILCPTSQADETVHIVSVEILPDLEGDAVEILADRPIAFVTYTLTDPYRLVIDPVEPRVESFLPESCSLGGSVVRSLRIRRPAGAAGAGPAPLPKDRADAAGVTGDARADEQRCGVDYLELGLAEPAEHLVDTSSGRLLLRIRPKGIHPWEAPLDSSSHHPTGQALPATGAEPMPAIAPADLRLPTQALAPMAAPSNRPKPDTWSFEEALGFGLARHRPVRVARQEVELSQMKVREARRALYPAGTLKFTWTDGIASNVNFREYSAGLQVEHPLYYSGRLIEAYRQSLVNLQVAEKRQGKVKADYSMELAQNYYQLVGAHLSRAVQAGLVAEAEDFLERARERYGKDLLTRLETLNVEAQANQARFQRASADNDVSLARLKFLQKLSLPSESPVETPGEFEPPALRPVDLEEALQLALRYKPDIQVSSLLVRFHEYEERIAVAKGKWKVDLSGFIGSSAAAFESEPLDSGEDYFVGIKASRRWGPHGTNASATRTKTSPRLGQTTRTESTVYSAEMGIVDQLQGLTEIQQARVNLEKTRRDLEEAKSSALEEVQEAHISYEKALLQMKYSEQKIAFRQEQVKILKAQASLNEALPSQVLEAILKLTEERVAHAQALSNYYVALAKLNKAVGLPGHYR